MKQKKLLFLAIVILLFLALGVAAQHDHDHGNSHPNQGYEKIVMPPIPYDSALNTNIYGEVKRMDGENEAVFHLKTEPMPAIERRVTNGSKFLLLNEWLTPKRSFQKILVKVLSNPPSNKFLGDTGWIELSHTSLFPYYDNEANKVDSNFIYKKYVNASAKFMEQSTASTCAENKKCYAGYAKYYDCLAASEREHTAATKCKTKNCTIVECPGDATPK